MDDADVLRIFQRLNTYSVKLNAQELRNGQFFGQFKSSAYEIAYENIEFWRTNRIFSERDIARMREAELVSELLIVLIDGMQDKKTSITSFYEKLDESFPSRAQVKQKFDRVIDAINESMKGELSDTEFRRSPLFYSLFTAVAHRAYGVPKMKATTPKKIPTPAERGKLRDAVLKLSDLIGAGRDDAETVPAKYSAFVNACLRQTDNVRPRQLRATTIYTAAFV